MKKYLNAIRRRLNMPKNLRQRVINDLESSISSRKEAGQTNEEIMQEFGSPKQAAAELNRQMEEYTYKKSPWRWGCLVLMVLSTLSSLFQGLGALMISVFNYQQNHGIGVIGGADGPTAIFISAPEDYFIQQLIIAAILLIMSSVGFWALSHIKRKQ